MFPRERRDWAGNRLHPLHLYYIYKNGIYDKRDSLDNKYIQ